MSKILLLGSHHGDERLGDKLIRYIKAHRPKLMKHVEFKIANLKAHRKNVRYIESDMNRSYNGKKDTYEERRAGKILEYIKESDFDLILDLHTTSCDQPPSLIMASINSDNERFIKASTIRHLVIMEPKTVSTALNGVCANSVAVEINRHIADITLENLCDDIQRYIDGEKTHIDKYIYEVDLLKNDEVTVSQFEKLRNFEYSDPGFYPILVGESSYQKQGYDYLGFKATERKKYKV